MGRKGRLKIERRLARDLMHALPESLQAPSRAEAPRSRMLRDDNGRPLLHIEQPSRLWDPMQRIGEDELPGASEDWRCFTLWRNAWYEASARSYPAGFPIGGGPYMILGIGHMTERAVHDWRDFQRIKNDICGDEWEGLELYPSESRLVDPSNRYYLWCVPPGVITWGLQTTGRRVWDLEEALAPQRPFPREIPS